MSSTILDPLVQPFVRLPMMTDVRTRREQNEEIGFYHVHIENAGEDEFVDKAVISRAKTPTDALNDESFWDDFSVGRLEAVLPSYERIRRRLKSTLLINWFLGCVVLAVSAITLAYCSWNYSRMTANGLRSVLIVLIVQGNSLISTSLLGLSIYKERNSSWSVQLFYNMLLLVIVVAFLTVNSNLPNTESVIKSISHELNKYQVEYGTSAKINVIGHGWCCSVHGFQENCYDPSEKAFTKKDLSHERLFDSINRECFKLVGWALAETLIKSCSCFLVPGLLLIILINALIHYGSSSNSGFVRICETESTLDKENIL